jgi:cardiolipin synthase
MHEILGIVGMLVNRSGMPAFAGNTVELLPDYDGAIENIVEAIDRVQKYIHIEYFMFADDSTRLHSHRCVDSTRRGLSCPD